MKKEEISKLFPVTLQVTKEMIDAKGSIGEMLLKSFFPQEIHEDLFWGLSIGSIKGVLLKTEKTVKHEGKTMKVPFYLQRSEITEPISVTFELR